MWIGYILASYIVSVSLYYLSFRFLLSVEDVSEEDFKMSIILMWVPVLNLVDFFINLFMAANAIQKRNEEKRKVENKPSFHERLYAVQKVNGKYRKKKECTKP